LFEAVADLVYLLTPQLIANQKLSVGVLFLAVMWKLDTMKKNVEGNYKVVEYTSFLPVIDYSA